MDVKSIFLNVSIKEEVYVEQPPGFKSEEYLNHVYKLHKVFYGLKQAPRAWYPKGSRFELLGYSDANYARCKVDRKSTSGTCQLLGRSLVSWTSKKQNSVALSMTKAEYITADSCCAQLLWMRQTLKDYGYTMNHIPLLCDNESAIKIAYNPCEHSRTKYIDIRHHFLRDHVIKGDIVISHVGTNNQLADIFTKPLNEKRFHELRSELNIIDSHNVA
jgi:hypothetical protein